MRDVRNSPGGERGQDDGGRGDNGATCWPSSRLPNQENAANQLAEIMMGPGRKVAPSSLEAE